MSTYKVAGRGEKNKFFDEAAYRSAVNYVLDPEKAVYAGGCNVSSVRLAAQEMEETAMEFGKENGKKVRHSVLSFGENEHVTPEQAELLAHYNSVTTIHFTLVYRGETDKADAYIKVQDDYLKNNPIDNTPKETEEENNG